MTELNKFIDDWFGPEHRGKHDHYYASFLFEFRQALGRERANAMFVETQKTGSFVNAEYDETCIDKVEYLITDGSPVGFDIYTNQELRDRE